MATLRANALAEAALSAAVDARYEINRRTAGSKNYERAAEQVVRNVDRRLRRHSPQLNIELAFPGQEDGADVVSRVFRARSKLSNSTANDEGGNAGLLFYRSWFEGLKIASESGRAEGLLTRAYARLIRTSVEWVLQVIDVTSLEVSGIPKCPPPI